MPYLSFDLDALTVVPDVAESAGITEGAVAHGLLKMWAYCFRKKRDTVQEAHIQGFFGGDNLRVSTVLVAFEFLEEDGGEFRVKGAGRYLRVQKAKVAGAAKTNAKRWGSDAGATGERQESDRSESLLHRAPNTEHLLEEEELEEPPVSDGVRAMGGMTVPAVEAGAEPDRRSEESPLREKQQPIPPGATVTPPTSDPGVWQWRDFWAWCQDLRRKGGFIPEKLPASGPTSGWWSACLMEEGVTGRAMRDGFTRFGQSKHWENSNPPYPFRAFVAGWRDYVRPEVRNGTAA